MWTVHKDRFDVQTRPSGGRFASTSRGTTPARTDCRKSLDHFTGSQRVFRGASWEGQLALYHRSVFRGSQAPGYCDNLIGFRLALSIDAPVAGSQQPFMENRRL